MSEDFGFPKVSEDFGFPQIRLQSDHKNNEHILTSCSKKSFQNRFSQKLVLIM